MVKTKTGRLGDGTKISQDVPVKIADDVAQIGDFSFIKTNGELWKWDSNNPTPQKIHDNVCCFVDNGRILLSNGQLIGYGQYGEEIVIAENVRLPQIVSIP